MARTLIGGVELVGAVAVGTGVGNAVGGAIEPAVQQLQNDAWTLHAVKPVAAGLLAGGVAQGQVDYGAAAEWAKQQGYDAAQFDAMVAVADTGPGLGQAFRLWRRDLINDAGFRRAAKRLGIEEEWLDALEQTRQEPLDPAVLAAAIVRGLIPDPGILPVGPPSGTGKVPRFPVFNVDAVEDAKWAGVDLARLSVMVGNYGRPMSPEAAAAATFRSIIERVDFDRAISEGDIRNEWADAIFETARYVLSPADAAGLRLRGWKTKAEAQAIGDLHGASPETMEDLYLNRGRPATTHQVHLGYARGGALAGFEGNERGAFGRAVEESDIRTEWTDVLWAQRYTYPSAFVLRALVTDGTFTAAQGEQILLESGWRPDLAKQAAAKWAGATAAGGKALTLSELRDEYEGGFVTEPEYRAALAALGYTGAAADLEVALGDARRVKLERARVVTALHKLYVSRELDDANASARLGEVGVGAEAVARMLAYWQVERDAATAQLTAAQLRSAYRKQLITRAEAIARLEALGYSATDAGLYLDS